MNADLPMCCLTGGLQSYVRSTVYCWRSTTTGKHLQCGFSVARNGREQAQELFFVTLGFCTPGDQTQGLSLLVNGALLS